MYFVRQYIVDEDPTFVSGPGSAEGTETGFLLFFLFLVVGFYIVDSKSFLGVAWNPARISRGENFALFVRGASFACYI